jgi:hypothetical protein
MCNTTTLLAPILLFSTCHDNDAPPPAAQEVVETVTTDPPFQSDLAPYGTWVTTPTYGWVWVPRSTAPDWRPYTCGHWVFVDDCGWTWVSDEPWGGVAYHYGRWYFDVSLGWAWVPGTVWGPNWVVWRHGGGFVGWAPLPPHVEIGFVCAHPAWVDFHVGATTWVFVEQRHFCEPTLRSHVVVAARNPTLVRSARNVTDVKVVRGHTFDRSLDVRDVARFGSKPVPRAQIERKPERSTLIERSGSKETRHVIAAPPQHPKAAPPTKPRPQQRPPKSPSNKQGH